MINYPPYLKLSEVCRMFGLEYSKVYANRIDATERKALEMFFKAVEKTKAEFFFSAEMDAEMFNSEDIK